MAQGDDSRDDSPYRDKPLSREEIEANRKRHYQLNLRVSDLAKDLLTRIAEKHGLTLTHALEYAIRQTAKEEGVFPGYRRNESDL